MFHMITQASGISPPGLPLASGWFGLRPATRTPQNCLSPPYQRELAWRWLYLCGAMSLCKAQKEHKGFSLMVDTALTIDNNCTCIKASLEFFWWKPCTHMWWTGSTDLTTLRKYIYKCTLTIFFCIAVDLAACVCCKDNRCQYHSWPRFRAGGGRPSMEFGPLWRILVLASAFLCVRRLVPSFCISAACLVGITLWFVVHTHTHAHTHMCTRP